MHLRPLESSDEIAISVLLDSAFGGPHMYQFAKMLREDDAVAMERIAEEDGAVIGYVCFAKMVAPAQWWSLAIVAVSPSFHKRGMGREIITRGLNHARREQAPAVTVVGDPKYFSRVGFSALAASKLETSFTPEHTLLFPIAPGSGMSEGVLRFPKAYAQFTAAEEI